jgi:hypothetical protein
MFISSRQRRILRRLTKAVDRALAQGKPTDQDPWCLAWSKALKSSQIH